MIIFSFVLNCLRIRKEEPSTKCDRILTGFIENPAKSVLASVVLLFDKITYVFLGKTFLYCLGITKRSINWINVRGIICVFRVVVIIVLVSEHIITVRNEVAKVMFLHMSVILFTGGGGCAILACIAGGGCRRMQLYSHRSVRITRLLNTLSFAAGRWG